MKPRFTSGLGTHAAYAMSHPPIVPARAGPVANPMKSLFQKILSPAKPPLAPVAKAAAVEGSSSQLPKQKSPPPHAVLKMPAELMGELFPEREVMVSVLFDESIGADPLIPVVAALPPELPPSPALAHGKYETPEVLSISDELREAIFPTQKVMVSVIFNLRTTPSSPGTEAVQPRREREESSGDCGYPII